MNRLSFFIITLPFLLVLSSGITIKNRHTFRAGKDYALFIAVQEYDHWNPLRNPISDVEAIAGTLHDDYGFQTEIVRNPTQLQIFRKLNEYRNRMYSPDDQLFVFFSGHGAYREESKEGFFIPKDGKANDDDGISYLPHSRLASIIDNIPCKRILIAIDACYSGTFDQRLAYRGNESSSGAMSVAERTRFIERQLRYKARLYLTSGGNERTPDGERYSPFTEKMLQTLRTQGAGDGIITTSELFGTMESVAPEPRMGIFGSHEPGGDFIFIYDHYLPSTQSSQGSFSRPEPDSPSKGSNAKEVPNSNGASKKATSKERLDPNNSSRVSAPIDNINYTFYVADSRNISGGILTLQDITNVGQSSLLPYYSSPSTEIHAATFDKSGNSYYLSANRYDIYKSDGNSETKIYTHTTYVRDIAIDKQGRIYFSESTGASRDGVIYALDLASKTASPYVTVSLQQVGGFWAGNFAFDPNGKLYISNGNQVPAAIYEFNGAVFSKRYDFQGSIQGFTFANTSTLYFTSNYNSVYKLENFQTLTPIFTSSNNIRLTDIDKQVSNMNKK